MDTLKLAVGSVAVRDDRLVVVCEVMESGGFVVRDLVTSNLVSAIADELSALPDPVLDRKQVASAAALTRSSAAQWERAQLREKCVIEALTKPGPVLANIAEVARSRKVAERSLRRWVALYRESPTASTLLDPRWGVQSGARRLDIKVESVIRRAIDELYLTRPKASYIVVHEEVERQCQMAGVAAPSLNALIRRIKGLDPWIVAHRQLGREEAERRLGPKPGSLQASAPLAIVQIDHTLVDVHVVDDIHRKSIGRPWITLAIDVSTRCVVGFHLSLEPPSTESVAACITHACLPKDRWLTALGVDARWPIWGLPHILHADNAKEFKTEALSKGCSDWAIDMVWRPVGKPHYGGHIERLIGTLMGRVHLLPGTTMSNSVKKGRYRSEESANLTLRELESWIALEICERYHLHSHLHSHRAIAKAPLDAWQDWFATRGHAPAIPGDRDKFKLTFLPIIRRTMRPGGIYFMNIQYWDNVLTAIAPMQSTVLLRYDPNDLSRLYALDANGRYWSIPYADLRQPSITLAEAKVSLAARKDHEKGRRQDHRMFERALNQRKVVKEAAAKTKSARRKQQRTTESALQAINPNPPPPPTKIDFNKPAPDYGVEIWVTRR